MDRLPLYDNVYAVLPILNTVFLWILIVIFLQINCVDCDQQVDCCAANTGAFQMGCSPVSPTNCWVAGTFSPQTSCANVANPAVCSRLQ
jgi:hypothetical protein